MSFSSWYSSRLTVRISASMSLRFLTPLLDMTTLASMASGGQIMVRMQSLLLSVVFTSRKGLTLATMASLPFTAILPRGMIG